MHSLNFGQKFGGNETQNKLKQKPTLETVPRLLVNRVQMAEKQNDKLKKRYIKNKQTREGGMMSARGRRPESPLVVGTCKTLGGVTP